MTTVKELADEMQAGFNQMLKAGAAYEGAMQEYIGVCNMYDWDRIEPARLRVITSLEQYLDAYALIKKRMDSAMKARENQT